MTKEQALEEIYAMQDSISQLSNATGTNDYRLAMQQTKIDKLEDNIRDLDSRCARLEVEKELADSLLVHTAQKTNEMFYIYNYGNTKRIAGN